MKYFLGGRLPIFLAHTKADLCVKMLQLHKQKNWQKLTQNSFPPQKGGWSGKAVCSGLEISVQDQERMPKL